MPVFLSHKREDKPKALRIGEFFKSHGIRCYIDVLDPELSTTNDITEVIKTRVKQCTHLMAVVSDNTQKSWWVSFEIGVASELKRRITSFDTGKTTLPEFLEKWPVLSSEKHLSLFVKAYKKDVSISLEEAHGADYSMRGSIKTDQQFHENLKQSINMSKFY